MEDSVKLFVDGEEPMNSTNITTTTTTSASPLTLAATAVSSAFESSSVAVMDVVATIANSNANSNSKFVLDDASEDDIKEEIQRQQLQYEKDIHDENQIFSQAQTIVLRELSIQQAHLANHLESQIQKNQNALQHRLQQMQMLGANNVSSSSSSSSPSSSSYNKGYSSTLPFISIDDTSRGGAFVFSFRNPQNALI
jgi:hypothetical protein